MKEERSAFCKTALKLDEKYKKSSDFRDWLLLAHVCFDFLRDCRREMNYVSHTAGSSQYN